MSGERIYMLKNPHYGAGTSRTTKSLAWEPYPEELMVSLTLIRPSLRKTWDNLTPHYPQYTNPRNPKHRPLINHDEELYRVQLLPNPTLEDFNNRLLDVIDLSLHQKN